MPTDAANQEPVMGSAQRVVVARARAPRHAAVQHCLEYLGSEHPDFELEGSARSVVQFEGVLPDTEPCVAYAPVDLDGQVSIVVDVLPEVYKLICLVCETSINQNKHTQHKIQQTRHQLLTRQKSMQLKSLFWGTVPSAKDDFNLQGTGWNSS